jgi:hypothetical protein
MGTTWDDELLDRLSGVGDPDVDAVIAAHVEAFPAVGEEPRRLVRDVAHHLVLPPASRSPVIDAYLNERPPLPPWADPAKLHRSARFFKEYGLEIGAGLFCASLPESYAAPRGAKVLALTGRLVTDPVRRVHETAQMVLDSLTSRGLDPSSGRGYQDIRRVRLMHGAVRHLVAHDPAIVHVNAEPVPEEGWLASWGVPLCQEDLFGGLLTFTITTFETLDKLGVPASEADADAFLHRWCVIGHLLGLQPDLLPLELAEARSLAELIRGRQQGATADGHLLVMALASALEGGLPLGFRGLVPATIRWFVGPKVAGDLDLPQTPWSLALQGPLRSMMVELQLEAHHDKARCRITREWTKRIMQHFMQVNRGGSRAPFKMPEELAPTFQPSREHFRFLSGGGGRPKR